MDNSEKLAGLIKEKAQEATSEVVAKFEKRQADQDEELAKLKEENVAWKAQMDAMQDKKFKVDTKTAGEQVYLFKGFNPDVNKNFKGTISHDQADIVAKTYIDMITNKRGGNVFADIDKAFDGSNALGVQYGSSLMGLAERNSVALTYADVIVADDPVIKLPSKATRDAVDSQSPGTANREGTSTLGQITWTIDKFVGNYMELLTNQIEDSKFDIVNTFIIPMQAEAVGQNYDDEMFNGTEYTSSVADATASVTASGTIAMAAAVTFPNLNTMWNALSWDRGIVEPMWFGPQAVYKDVMGLVGTTNDHPVFLDSLTARPVKQILGSRYIVTPVIADVPADGAIRLAFGDPRHYRIFVRGSEFRTMVNPYIKMKEHYVQFICDSRSDGNISDHATPASSGAWTTLARDDS